MSSQFCTQSLREIILSSVQPSEDEVVVSIWFTFHSSEPLLCSTLVPLCLRFCTQGEDSHHKTSINGILLPLLPCVSLNTLLRPIPSILGLHHLHLTIDFKNYSTVSYSTSSSPFNKLIQTIQSCDSQEVTISNLMILEIHKDIVSLRNYMPSRPSNELNI